jgi:cation:H+ antiporter
MTALYLIISFALILVSAELFTNGIEWFGRRFGICEGALGSVLAAVGTALPETLVPIVALIALNGSGGKAIGVGAIVGGPFMLSSLAMFVTGVAVIFFAWKGRRTRRVAIQPDHIRRDLLHFLCAYVLALAAGLIHLRPLNYALAAGLLASYVYYVWHALRREGDLEGACGPLWFHRRPSAEPHTWRIIVQLLLSLAGIVAGAELFVHSIRDISATLGASALVVSLLIAPVATELPETYNSFIWIRRKQDVLALGNVTGAMVFQSTFPVSVGLLFTSWRLPAPAIVSMVLALGSSLALYVAVKRFRVLPWWLLSCGGLFYAAFVLYILLR